VPPRPEGWKVVEFGDVRVSVPPTWEATRCDGEPEAATLTLCGRGESYVTLRPEQLDGVTATETRNGLEVKYRHADCTPARDQLVLCDSLDLVDLDVRVEAVSTDPDTVDGILRSVGVSGRWRAEHEPLPPGPRSLAGG
jgi:hypothetical protein